MDSQYEDYYSERNLKDRSQKHVYPVEFVVRTLLGTYPELKLNKKDYPGKNILDLKPSWVGAPVRNVFSKRGHHPTLSTFNR